MTSRALLLLLAACGSFGTDGTSTTPTRDASAGDDDDDAGVKPTATYRETVLADSPMFYLTLDEATGSTAVTSLPGGETFQATDCVFGEPGAHGSGARFDEVTSKIVLSTIKASARSPLTFEVWFTLNAPVPPGISTLISVSNGGGLGYWLGLQPDRTFFHRLDGFASIPLATLIVPPVGKATHVVATYDGSALRLFQDGAEKANADEPEAMPSLADTYDAQVGTLAGTYAFRGILDEVAIYERALTPERIKAHFDARASK